MSNAKRGNFFSFIVFLAHFFWGGGRLLCGQFLSFFSSQLKNLKKKMKIRLGLCGKMSPHTYACGFVRQPFFFFFAWAYVNLISQKYRALSHDLSQEWWR